MCVSDKRMDREGDRPLEDMVVTQKDGQEGTE